MLQVFRAGVFLIAFNLLAVNIPGIMPQLSRFSGLLILCALIGLYLPIKIDKSHLKIVIPALFTMLASFALLLREFTNFLGIAIFIFSLDILLRVTNSTQKNSLPVFLLTTVFYTIFVILYQFIPHIWYILQNASLAFSVGVSSMIGKKMMLGATAMGMPITISLLCYCLSAFILAQERKIIRLLLSVLILIGVNVAYIWLQTPMTKLIHLVNKRWHPTPMDFQAVLLLLLMTAVYPMIRKVEFRDVPLRYSVSRWKYALPAIFIIFAASFTLTFHAKGKKIQGTVVFCDKGPLNWAVPMFGKRYGKGSAGMFGMLPKYLEMRGNPTKIWKKTLTNEALQNASALVVINPTKYFSSAERGVIWHFIENGGSLLVAGDHTDVLGIMGPINDLLLPSNISINFDTALPFKTGWIHSLEKRPHPITKHIGEAYETSIWVGASLHISPPAQPVIIGKRGWADIGNHANIKRAYLGDYKRGPDEQLGDVVLVAEAYYGKGKVLVFGDTSTLQNGVLMISYPFIDRIFDWLSRRGNTQHPVRNLLLALFLLIPAGYLLSKARLSAVLVLACFFVANVALLITSYTRATHAEIRSQIHKAPDSASYRIAYIDVSHHERFGISAPSGNSAWGISMNLMRNGYIPLFMNRFSEQALFNSRLFVVIAPTVKFSRYETDVLKRFMQNGGIVIWTVGWEELEASRRFIEEFDFSIDSVPLGPSEVDIEKEKVQFFEAWPVLGGSDSKQIIAEKWDYPLLVYQPVGKGGLLLAGDSGFLLSKNLESYKGYNIKNIRFLKYLFEKMGF